MKAVAEINKVSLFASPLAIDGSAVKHWIVRNDTDDLSVHARQSCNDRFTKSWLDFKA